MCDDPVDWQQAPTVFCQKYSRSCRVSVTTTDQAILSALAHVLAHSSNPLAKEPLPYAVHMAYLRVLWTIQLRQFTRGKRAETLGKPSGF